MPMPLLIWKHISPLKTVHGYSGAEYELTRAGEASFKLSHTMFQHGNNFMKLLMVSGQRYESRHLQSTSAEALGELEGAGNLCYMAQKLSGAPLSLIIGRC